MTTFFGYWEVWHVVLAAWLTILVMRFYPYEKQKVIYWVLGIAIAYEISEIFWNQGAYTGWRHQFGNSMKDIVAAMVGMAGVFLATVNRKLL